MKQSIGVLAALALMTSLLVPSAVSGQNQQQPMGFFITSAGPGDGATLGAGNRARKEEEARGN